MGTKSTESLTDNPEEVQRNRNAEMGTVSLALPDSDLGVTEVDPWALTELVDNSPKWSDLDTSGKVKRVFMALGRGVGILLLLYLFVCSLDFLSSAFRLIGGRTTGEIFQQSELLKNPVVGVMIGILVTVLVQSSSTSTSIVVSMVGSGILTVSLAIPIVMGANIGTSVTNTIVSFTQIGDRNEFRRAFAAATVHDMFNWLTVIVLFIVEIAARETFGKGYLEYVSEVITRDIGTDPAQGGEVKMLSVITEPFTKLIIQLDKNVIEKWALNDTNYYNATLIQERCTFKVNGTKIYEKCSFAFSNTGLSDLQVGLILLVIALVLLCGCLVCIVKILNSVLKGQIANVIKKVINANIPYVPWVTGYLALLVGAIMTFLVQSSSVFTSALTPLVGVGVITIERVYPLTLGSNIGTTTTSLIAAMAADAKNLQYTLQISLCHLLFNLTGIVLFYPIPFLRFPIPMAKFLGETTSKYRWFSIAYLIGMFFLLPAIIFGLSVAGNVALLVVLIPMSVILFVVFVICVMQRKKPSWLPAVLRNWKFLPLWMRSLEPVDRIISRLTCTSYCTSCQDAKDVEGDEKTTINMKPLTMSTSDVPLQYVNGYENGQIVSGISNPSYDRNE